MTIRKPYSQYRCEGCGRKSGGPFDDKVFQKEPFHQWKRREGLSTVFGWCGPIVYETIDVEGQFLDWCLDPTK